MNSRLSFFNAGYCRGPGWAVVRGGPWRILRLPSRVALIEHPTQGFVLYDTGFGLGFERATARWPYRLHRYLVPFEPGPPLLDWLGDRRPGTVILSHFHGDHMGGLCDFPAARIVYHREGYEEVRGLTGLAAMRKAYFPQLLPADFLQRGVAVQELPRTPLEPPLDWGWDLFDDGQLRLVELPGHARGQLGLLVRTDEGLVLLIADAAWVSRGVEENRPPRIRLIEHDRRAADRTLARLHQLYLTRPDIRQVPSHCPRNFPA